MQQPGQGRIARRGTWQAAQKDWESSLKSVWMPFLRYCTYYNPFQADMQLMTIF